MPCLTSPYLVSIVKTMTFDPNIKSELQIWAYAKDTKPNGDMFTKNRVFPIRDPAAGIGIWSKTASTTCMNDQLRSEQQNAAPKARPQDETIYVTV